MYDRIISMDNLRLADERARRGKLRSYGVRRHDRNREANLEALHAALEMEEYRTSPYTVFTIHEPKERLIYRLPYYPDRIVHHAVMNVLEQVWMSVFTHNTFSCVKGRGIDGCARHVERIMRRYGDRQLYCLRIDIRKCYPSMRHDVLKMLVRRKIKDVRLLRLLDGIIDSAPGLPIGNYLSQYLANLCFAYFMHWVNETLRLDCAEYADDFVFFSVSKRRLHVAFQKIRRYIEGRLGLEVKGNWQVFPVGENRYDRRGRALDFVGYRFYRHQKLLRKGIKQRFCRAVRRMERRKRPPSAEEFRRVVSPWLGWAMHSDSRNLLNKIITKERRVA